MKIIEFLEQVRVLDEAVEMKKAECRRISRAAAGGFVGVSYAEEDDGWSVTRGERAAAALRCAENELKERVDEYKRVRARAAELIGCLPMPERELMHMHYILYMPWESVAEDMAYSTTHIYRLRRRAVGLLERMAGEERCEASL